MWVESEPGCRGVVARSHMFRVEKAGWGGLGAGVTNPSGETLQPLFRDLAMVF